VKSIVIISKSVYYNLYIYFLILYKILIWLPLFSYAWKATKKNKKGKKVHAVFLDLFILKNMGAAIIDFRVWPPLVKCQNIMFSGFIDTLMYGFSSTGVTIYCYFCLKFNDMTKKNKKGKKVHAVFHQVGFILILYGEYNGN
jgi:hypothetical protein